MIVTHPKTLSNRVKPKKMHVELNLEQDILCLYTPTAAPRQRIHHTRSALLQRNKGDGEDTVFTILCTVTFNLIVSLPANLPINAFLRTLLLAYNRHAYTNFFDESDAKLHQSIYADAGVSDRAKAYLRRIDQQNVENMIYCTRLKLLQDTPENEKDGTPAAPWLWHKAGSAAIGDVNYRQMRNINFIREVTEIDIHNEDDRFANEVQYKIMLDNHLILLYLLERLKYGTLKVPHSGLELSYTVKVLDPLPVPTTRNRYELFKRTKNPMEYIEKQLDAKKNHSFYNVMTFSNRYECKGGLVHPSLLSSVTAPSESANKVVHTIKEMLSPSLEAAELLESWDQASDENWLQTKKPIKAKVTSFRVLHNPFYIDLSLKEHIHVEYYEAKRDVARHDKTPIKPLKKSTSAAAAAAASAADAVSSTSSRAVKVKGPGKNQPLLRGFISQIPEKSKRKHEEEEEEHDDDDDDSDKPLPALIIEEKESRPKKIQRTEKQQATLQQFFKETK